MSGSPPSQPTWFLHSEPMNPPPKRDRDRYLTEISTKLQLGSELFSKTLSLHGVNRVKTNQRRHFSVAWVKPCAKQTNEGISE